MTLHEKLDIARQALREIQEHAGGGLDREGADRDRIVGLTDDDPDDLLLFAIFLLFLAWITSYAA